MTHEIQFAVRAPDAATFWSSWIAGGICAAPYQWTAEYPGIQISDTEGQGWQATKSDGTVTPGFYANVRISGPLVEQFTYGLSQTDSEGNLLNLFDRTWAAEVFGLTMQPADPVSGFPTGMRNVAGVTYVDIREIKSPSNVWA